MSAAFPSKAMLHASELYEEAGHSFAQMGIKVGKPSVDLAALLKYKDGNVESNVKGVDFLFKKNKIEAFHGAGAHRRGGQGRGEGRRRQDADAGDEEHRHRHRLGRGAIKRHRHRREARRVLDRRARSCQSAAEAARRRRRHHRNGAGLGVAPARRRGDGGRVPRSHPARHRQRGRAAIPPHPAEAGHRLQAVVEGHRGRHIGETAQSEGRARRGRRGGDDRGRCRAGRDRSRALTPKGSVSNQSA